jgi:hypothetical protein
MASSQTTLLLPVANDATAPMVLHASKNPIPDDLGALDLSAIVECDFLGYAPQALNDFGETENDYPDNVGEALTEVKSFQAALDLVTAQPIHFLYITRTPTGGAPQLQCVQTLAEPFLMDRPLKSLDLRVRVMSTGLT